MRRTAVRCCCALSPALKRTQRGRPPKPFSFPRTLRGHVFSQPQRHVFTAGLNDSTIYALSTAPGRAAIAIVRISGPHCLDVFRTLCPGKQLPPPRRASVQTLYAPHQQPGLSSILDSDALVLYFPNPKTATGQDVLEFHIHGGQATVKAVLAAIPVCSTSGNVRYAEPGEFTRRAFLNDRLDLTQVEALGDVLAATTEQQRKLSVRGTGNALSKQYEAWRHQLLYARGELEALIDFSEDQHFDESPAELCSSVAHQVRSLDQSIAVHRQNAVRGELLRHGIAVSLLGAPNAGKSSLLNRIVGREAAIVSQEAGTTRDVVEVGLDLGGFFCRLGDTAGLRKARADLAAGQVKQDMIGNIEQEGMRRAKQRAAESDAVIVVLSFERDKSGNVNLQLDPEVVETARDLISAHNNVAVVINKSDLCHPIRHEAAIIETLDALPGLSKSRVHLISCKQAQDALELASTSSSAGNIQSFLTGLISFFSELTAAVIPGDVDSQADASIWHESLGASQRHRLLLDECAGYLTSFLRTVELNKQDGTEEDDVDIVLAAEHLRHAAGCLARITGKGDAGDVEEVLGVVFEKFCVGK